MFLEAVSGGRFISVLSEEVEGGSSTPAWPSAVPTYHGFLDVYDRETGRKVLTLIGTKSAQTRLLLGWSWEAGHDCDDSKPVRCSGNYIQREPARGNREMINTRRLGQPLLMFALLAQQAVIGYGQSVSLKNALMQAQVLPAQTTATDIPIQIEEGPSGRESICVTTDDPAVQVSLVFPNGITEIK